MHVAGGGAEGGAPVLSTRKKLLFASVLVLLAYVAAEAVTSTLYVRGVLWPSPTLYLFEESYRTIRFDPVRGLFLSREPSRFARITWGEICYDGVMRGNNEGFPDRDDFGPARPDAGTRRLAVLGDSFTSGQFNSCNWPDRVEDLALAQGERRQLLNLSVDGGGLLNWLSILEKHVVANSYEIDGVVFAVFRDDLVRGFHIRDDSHSPVDAAGQRTHRLGYVLSWDPAEFPESLAEAENDFDEINAYIVTPDVYEKALRGEWRPVESRPFRPFILWRVLNKLGVAWGDGLDGRRALEVAHIRDVAGRMRAYERIAEALKKLGVPVLVIRVPGIQELLGEVPDRSKDIREFASAIGADYLDGGEPFKELSPEEIRAHWLRYDHHWNQKGSDRFARFVWERLRDWP